MRMKMYFYQQWKNGRNRNSRALWPFRIPGQINPINICSCFCLSCQEIDSFIDGPVNSSICPYGFRAARSTRNRPRRPSIRRAGFGLRKARWAWDRPNGRRVNLTLQDSSWRMTFSAFVLHHPWHDSSSSQPLSAVSEMRSPNTTTAAAGGKTTPCCSKVGLKRGPWTPEEDELLSSYIRREGEGRWRTLPKRAGLLRCGKSCRLRWMNYLRPSVKRGQIAPDEEDLILRLHRLLGNRWSLIAGRIPGRTDNEIKNYWNTHLSKKLISQGIDPRTHKPLNPDADNSNNDDSPDANSAAKEASLSKHNPIINNHIINAPPSPTSNPNSASSETEEIDKTDTLPNTTNQFENGYLLPKYADVGMGGAVLRIGGEAVEDINNYCTDDMFSSFLNSLINDEAFAASSSSHHHNQLPLNGPSSSPSDPLMIANPMSALGLGWESAIMSSGFSQNNNETSKRDKPL